MPISYIFRYHNLYLCLNFVIFASQGCKICPNYMVIFTLNLFCNVLACIEGFNIFLQEKLMRVWFGQESPQRLRWPSLPSPVMVCMGVIMMAAVVCAVSSLSNNYYLRVRVPSDTKLRKYLTDRINARLLFCCVRCRSCLH